MSAGPFYAHHMDFNTLPKQARIDLALSPRINAQQVGHLAGDDDKDVRRYLATNPRVPAVILRHLLTDAVAIVRNSVYYNPALPIEVRREGVAAGIRHAIDGAPGPMQDVLAKETLTASTKVTAEMVNRAKTIARQRAFEKMGVALGAEDAELVEMW